MEKYKPMDSYDYIKSGKFFNSPSKIELFFFLKKVRLSQKINSDFHNIRVLCDMFGTILTGGCLFMAGNNKTFSHVGALLHGCLWTRLSTPPPLVIFLFSSYPAFKKVSSSHN